MKKSNFIKKSLFFLVCLSFAIPFQAMNILKENMPRKDELLKFQKGISTLCNYCVKKKWSNFKFTDSKGNSKKCWFAKKGNINIIQLPCLDQSKIWKDISRLYTVCPWHAIANAMCMAKSKNLKNLLTCLSSNEEQIEAFIKAFEKKLNKAAMRQANPEDMKKVFGERMCCYNIKFPKCLPISIIQSNDKWVIAAWDQLVKVKEYKYDDDDDIVEDDKGNMAYKWVKKSQSPKELKNICRASYEIFKSLVYPKNLDPRIRFKSLKFEGVQVPEVFIYNSGSHWTAFMIMPLLEGEYAFLFADSLAGGKSRISEDFVVEAAKQFGIYKQKKVKKPKKQNYYENIEKSRLGENEKLQEKQFKANQEFLDKQGKEEEACIKKQIEENQKFFVNNKSAEGDILKKIWNFFG